MGWSTPPLKKPWRAWRRGDWPPLVPAARMVERFTALTIGKHAEDPASPLAEHAEEAFRLAVLPALAWGLVAHLYELSENLRADAQAALASGGAAGWL